MWRRCHTSGQTTTKQTRNSVISHFGFYCPWKKQYESDWKSPSPHVERLFGSELKPLGLWAPFATREHFQDKWAKRAAASRRLDDDTVFSPLTLQDIYVLLIVSYTRQLTVCASLSHFTDYDSAVILHQLELKHFTVRYKLFSCGGSVVWCLAQWRQLDGRCCWKKHLWPFHSGVAIETTYNSNTLTIETNQSNQTTIKSMNHIHKIIQNINTSTKNSMKIS